MTDSEGHDVRMKTVATAAVGVLVVGILPAGASPVDAARAPVGSPGIGDPYFPRYGNGGYRVGHYDVHVRFNPRSERLTGDTTVTGRVTRPLTRFNLDLVLRASSVRVNGSPARFRQTRRELVVRNRSEIS